jgi:hypothetical protein
VSPRRYQNNYCIVGLNLGAVLKIHGVELIWRLGWSCNRAVIQALHQTRQKTVSIWSSIDRDHSDIVFTLIRCVERGQVVMEKLSCYFGASLDGWGAAVGLCCSSGTILQQRDNAAAAGLCWRAGGVDYICSEVAIKAVTQILHQTRQKRYQFDRQLTAIIAV